MRVLHYLTTPVKRPWALFALALFVTLTLLFLFTLTRSPVGHDLSASEFAVLQFEGLISQNGTQFGAFTISNLYRHRLSFSVNNIEIKTPAGWRYYASWSRGSSRTNAALGNLDNYVDPGKAQTFHVPVPRKGQAWRVHVGVLRGIQGFTLRRRAIILWQTHSLPAALTFNRRLRTNYYQFTYVGMLDGPEISSVAQPGAAPSDGPARLPVNSEDAAEGHHR